MIEHLPECTWAKFEFEALGKLIDAYVIECPTCAGLRDCEQRVLDEARQTIATLAEDMADWSSEETTTAYQAMPGLTAGEWMWAQRGVQRALAALDDLRDKP